MRYDYYYQDGIVLRERNLISFYAPNGRTSSGSRVAEPLDIKVQDELGI
jgi:hypothetical protein